MKHIANILTNEPYEGSEFYNVVDSKEKLISGIPTLIIGWDRTKSEYPDASIIEWRVTDNVYWTYGKYERRDKYETNVKQFQAVAFKKFLESLKYVFYDVILLGPDKFESFIKSLSNDTPKTAYISNDILYIYIEGKPVIVGLSLRDCDYIDETYKKRIFSVIYGNDAVTLIKNNETVSKEARYEARGMAYILPYLYSK